MRKIRSGEGMNNNFRIGEYTLPQDTAYSYFDTLGFNTARDAFIQIIEAVRPPLTVGLYGSWGSGKTTMIQGMDEALRKSSLTLVFDAWKYRHEKNLILPLLCALQRKHQAKSVNEKDSALKIVGSVAVAALSGYIKHKTGIEFGDIRSIGEMYEEGYEYYKKYDDSVSNIEEEYKKFIDQLLNNTNWDKVVIFVDNLDRCLPDVVVNLLEDISSFLSIRDVRCVYVLAMDKENVIKAINHLYPDFDGGHYLEKIIQIPLKMPLPSDGRAHFMKRYQIGKDFHASPKTEFSDVRNEIFQKLADFESLFVSDLLGNPRRTERMINKLMFLDFMCLFQAENNNNPRDTVILVVFLLLLNEYFEEIYVSLKTDYDYQVLQRFIQYSYDPKATPMDLRKDLQREMPNYKASWGVLYDAYCNEDNKFYKFLKQFKNLGPMNDLPKRLQQISKSLNYIG
jgi:hypothetical protein